MQTTEEADKNYQEELRWYERMKAEGARVRKPQRPKQPPPPRFGFKKG